MASVIKHRDVTVSVELRVGALLADLGFQETARSKSQWRPQAGGLRAVCVADRAPYVVRYQCHNFLGRTFELIKIEVAASSRC